MARQPRGDERHPVDSALGRTMEGLTGSLSVVTCLVIADSSSGSEMARSSGCLMVLAVDLRERGELDLTECFIDGTFVAAKKGVSTWERPSGAKV